MTITYTSWKLIVQDCTRTSIILESYKKICYDYPVQWWHLIQSSMHPKLKVTNVIHVQLITQAIYDHVMLIGNYVTIVLFCVIFSLCTYLELICWNNTCQILYNMTFSMNVGTPYNSNALENLSSLFWNSEMNCI